MSEKIKKGICILRCENHNIHGIVKMEEIFEGGPIRFTVYIKNISVGKHGFHIHRLGNEQHGAESLCDHFNPEGYNHGDLNSEKSHVGDLGNLVSKNEIYYDDQGSRYRLGTVKSEFIALRVRLTGEYSVYGRSLVVHSSEDDLGKGGHEDSLKTGHSGSRILWGIIGVDDDCA